MDWPTKSVLRRIAWIRLGLRIRRRPRKPAAAPAPEPTWWPEFEREFRAYADAPTERLHTLQRPSRSPLFILTVSDASGHLLKVAACDPEDRP
jgi:hypothetical protein